MIGLENVDRFAGDDELILDMIMLFATFLTNIVILNMLIAIMSDTFERNQAAKTRNSVMQKLMLLTEYISLVQLVERFFACYSHRSEAKSLIIVRPEDSAEADSLAWEGKIGMIRKIISTRF
jgi:hypothetical protein